MRVEVCRRFGEAVQMFSGSARVCAGGACDAGVRARPPGVGGDSRGARFPRPGRSDNINVWHPVTVGKALSANKFAQLANGLRICAMIDRGRAAGCPIRPR
ncbi:hypothetical protein GCM10010329_39990 [Streptomyces spiroverticillatus]|uniref:Uncharacterized protein n=1 Tax=Streptomyces finlayi TaxID=67296 RepID=A0A919CBC7_9ACTN|nr:hypothetical protein GCM10010329_39990 [Streptomyces spiroverticillatus]GHC98103.1 hypothetical protein GCM10010334_40250 [Streptomyces finlayi]